MAASGAGRWRTGCLRGRKVLDWVTLLQDCEPPVQCRELDDWVPLNCRKLQPDE